MEIYLEEIELSWYTSFYLGIQDNDGKIRPYGPYSSLSNKMRPIIETSASFTSNLKDYFNAIPDDAWTPELEKEFSYTFDGEKTRSDYIGYLPLSQLPSGDFIKTGYFLIDEIDRYVKSQTDDEWYFDGFNDVLTPEAYVRMVENEIKFGPPRKKIDEFGEEVTPHSASEYAYFSYPEYQCKEYEAFLIRQVASMLDDYNDVPEGCQLVVLKNEG